MLSLSRAAVLCRRRADIARGRVAAASSRRLTRDFGAVVVPPPPPRLLLLQSATASSGGGYRDVSSSSSSSSYPSPSPPHRRAAIRTFAGRHDRASTSLRVRPPTRKQRKEYHRRLRERERERGKHSPPNSKAAARRAEQREHTRMLVEIAREEEALQAKLRAYFDKVNEIQSAIESSPKFQALLEGGNIPEWEMRQSAREAAKRAAERSDSPHPPLPSWQQDRLTYDWGDALVDDLMGNSADLTSSPAPYPVHMGERHGRLSSRRISAGVSR